MKEKLQKIPNCTYYLNISHESSPTKREQCPDLSSDTVLFLLVLSLFSGFRYICTYRFCTILRLHFCHRNLCSVILYYKVHGIKSRYIHIAVYLRIVRLCVDNICQINSGCFFHALKDFCHDHRHISGNLIHPIAARFGSAFSLTRLANF